MNNESTAEMKFIDRKGNPIAYPPAGKQPFETETVYARPGAGQALDLIQVNLKK